jgi:leader peptidase (prepilin peptidase)/N-methyltransferase
VTVLGVAACALLGLAVGLFLNVVIDRVPARQPLLPLRFRCARCPEEAADAPGLPLAAWLKPGGRCPVCRHRLAARCLLVPLANAALFAAAAVRFGADWALPAYLLFFAALLAISVIDFRLQIIPNRIVYPAIFVSVPLLALAALAQHDGSRLVRALIGAALAWSGLLIIHLISPAGMGFGDVRLSFLLGLFLGWLSYGHIVTGLFLGFLLGAVVGLVLVVLRVRARTDHVPFGPFLAAGAGLTVLIGGPLGRVWLGGFWNG